MTESEPPERARLASALEQEEALVRRLEEETSTGWKILAFVVDVEARITVDPTSAREALRRLLHDGRLVMHPQADGCRKGESVIFPLRLAGKTPKPQSGGPTGASGIATDKVEIGRCAGTMDAVCTAVSLVFERRLAA